MPCSHVCLLSFSCVFQPSSRSTSCWMQIEPAEAAPKADGLEAELAGLQLAADEPAAASPVAEHPAEVEAEHPAEVEAQHPMHEAAAPVAEEVTGELEPEQPAASLPVAPEGLQADAEQQREAVEELKNGAEAEDEQQDPAAAAASTDEAAHEDGAHGPPAAEEAEAPLAFFQPDQLEEEEGK